jgi:hypothetical protein
MQPLGGWFWRQTALLKAFPESRLPVSTGQTPRAIVSRPGNGYLPV